MPDPTIWNSRSRSPTTWPSRYATSPGSRNWLRTFRRRAAKCNSSANSWARKAIWSAPARCWLTCTNKWPGRPQPRHGTDSRRKRRGEGTGRAGDAFRQPAEERAVRLPQLCGTVGNAAGKRTVRPRAGRIHRRDGSQDRQVRVGPPGDADARRNRRDEPLDSGQVPPRAGRASLRTRRRQPADQSRRARHRRHESRSGKGRCRKACSAAILYFRLHVVEIYVPPLRKRPEDIVELANYFLDRFNAETGRKMRGFTPEALQRMQQYRWPGNVRELKNVIERAVVLARSEFIDTEDLNLSNLATASESGEMPMPKLTYEPVSLDEVEKRHILSTLKSTGWNKSRTASILGVERIDARPQDSPLRSQAAAREAGRLAGIATCISRHSQLQACSGRLGQRLIHGILEPGIQTLDCIEARSAGRQIGVGSLRAN